jgi:hypothetical protein
MTCVVDTLTTDGNSFAARSAKLSGAGRASAAPGKKITTPIRKAADRRTSMTGEDSEPPREVGIVSILAGFIAKLSPLRELSRLARSSRVPRRSGVATVAAALSVWLA